MSSGAHVAPWIPEVGLDAPDEPAGELPRPAPPRSAAERVTGWAAAWLGWFGPGRLVVSAVAVVVVCAGAYWLVRAPRPPTEASIPRAETTSPAVTTLPAAGTTGSSADAHVVVHVAGAVQTPGVYLLGAGARVHDAVALAGGTTADADEDALNLAAVVVDGSRVYVPRVGEEVPVPAGDPAPAPTGPVDVNRAGAAELDELPGVGPATAAAIVTERERNGPFLSVDDLDRVPGIGPAKLEALRELVTT